MRCAVAGWLENGQPLGTALESFGVSLKRVRHPVWVVKIIRSLARAKMVP